jgi:hypothetical protein
MGIKGKPVKTEGRVTISRVNDGTEDGFISIRIEDDKSSLSVGEVRMHLKEFALSSVICARPTGIL